MITILAPAFYQVWGKVHYLKESAERWNVPITFYGFGEPYKGWHDVQIDRLIEEIRKVDTKWIIYTDSSDVIVNGNMPVVEPWADVVISEESDGEVCAGGWIAEKISIIHVLDTLRRFTPCKECGPDTMNPQTKWRCALKWSLRNSVCNDSNRSIFQVADEPLEIHDKRVYNPRTKTFPFLVHWAGGYTDPEVGKAALIEPYWSQLYDSH